MKTIGSVTPVFYMKNIYLTIILLSVSHLSICQKIITDDTLNLQKGIYRNFLEFKLNRPSISYDFKMVPYMESVGSKSTTFHVKYKIDMQNGKKIKMRSDSIWGLCDGKNVFISVSIATRIENSKYEKLIYIGRYCLYTKLVERYNHNYNPSAIGGIGIQIGGIGTQGNTTEDIAININNGKTFLIDERVAEIILSQDEQIFQAYKDDKDSNHERQAYKDDKNNNHKRLEYIKIYSEKHKEEIK